MSLKSKNKNNVITYIDDAIPGETYYCPICNQPMIQKRGEIVAHHFAHMSPHGRPDIVPCSDHWHYCKSEWHYEWQKRFPVDCMERVLEYHGQKHIADVLVDKFVVEFQHSPISLDEFNDRNEFYTKLGYKVIWVFDLIEEFNDGRFAPYDDRNEWYYKWANPKKLFKEMDFSKVNATIFFQLDNNEESCVLERVVNIYHEGRHIKASPNNALQIQEFVDMINKNSGGIFEKPKAPPAPDSIDGCKSVRELWEPSYASMLIKNNPNNYVIRIYGKEGRMYTDRQTGRIRCLYTTLDPYINFYKTRGEYRNVFEEDKKIWTLVHAFKDSGYEERIAKQKKEMEEQENRRQEYYKITEPYQNAHQEGCLALNQLICKRFNDIVYVENVYNHKTYMVVVRNGYKLEFELYEINRSNICKKLSEDLSEELTGQIISPIWKIIDI